MKVATHSVSMHLCNWPDCRRPVPHDMWGCRSHWFTLPQEHRNAILEAWRFGHGRLSQKWIDANNAALEWIRGIPERAKDSRTVTPMRDSGGSIC